MARTGHINTLTSPCPCTHTCCIAMLLAHCTLLGLRYHMCHVAVPLVAVCTALPCPSWLHALHCSAPHDCMHHIAMAHAPHGCTHHVAVLLMLAYYLLVHFFFP